MQTLLLLSFLSLVLCDNFTCSDSVSLSTVTSQCSAVTWSVARIIDHNATIESDYYPVVLDLSVQENYVTVCVIFHCFN